MSGKTENKTALVFGASGLVGGYLLQQLIDDSYYSSIEVFLRKPLEVKHPKVVQHIVDFSRIPDFAAQIKGDDLFICLGTTIKKAGSVKKVEEIDRDIPLQIAEAAHKNGVARIAVVSSLGADATSRNYYLRIKGEMEAGIRKIPFQQIIITRPSMLFGDRTEYRFGEAVGKLVMKAVGPLLVGSARKYRGIEGNTVASAMITLIRSSRHDEVYLSDELQKFARK